MTSYVSTDVSSLLEALADSLTDNVLPGVAGHYARLQLEGACQMLRQLGHRLDWDAQIVDPAEAATQRCLATCRAALGTPVTDPANQGFVAGRAQLGALIDDLYDDVPGQDTAARQHAIDAVWELAKQEFSDESGLDRRPEGPGAPSPAGTLAGRPSPRE